jgi:hypothetical protein
VAQGALARSPARRTSAGIHRPLQPMGLLPVTPEALNRSGRPRVGQKWGRREGLRWLSMGVMMPIDQPGIPGRRGFPPPLLLANIVVVLGVGGSNPLAHPSKDAGQVSSSGELPRRRRGFPKIRRPRERHYLCGPPLPQNGCLKHGIGRGRTRSRIASGRGIPYRAAEPLAR